MDFFRNSVNPHCLKITSTIAFFSFEFWHFAPTLVHFGSILQTFWLPEINEKSRHISAREKAHFPTQGHDCQVHFGYPFAGGLDLLYLSI